MNVEHGIDDPGVEGNSRLTSLVGAVLLIMLAIEGYTLLDVHGFITLHLVVGLLLVGPIALKCATTVYRFTGYYTGRPAYVRYGPPHPVLRVLGPLVIVLSLAVMGTGIALVYTGRNDAVLFWHKASFVAWFAVTAVHVLGHIVELGRYTLAEFRPRAPRGRGLRFAAVAAALVVGVGATAVVYPSATEWHGSAASDRGPDDR